MKKNQKKQRESRFAFMTKSEVDHLDDHTSFLQKSPSIRFEGLSLGKNKYNTTILYYTL